jgi:hypothetical protein
MIGINRKNIPVSFEGKNVDPAPYRLQNKWEEIFDVPIP